jgi:hypothetical protein
VLVEQLSTNPEYLESSEPVLYTRFRLKMTISIRINKPELHLATQIEAAAASAGLSPAEWAKQVLIKHLESKSSGGPPGAAAPTKPAAPPAPSVASVEAVHDEVIALRDDVQKALSLALTRGLSDGEADAIAEMLHELFRGRSTE